MKTYLFLFGLAAIFIEPISANCQGYSINKDLENKFSGMNFKAAIRFEDLEIWRFENDCDERQIKTMRIY